MTRQLSDDVCDAARREALRFLASRPDLGPADLTQYTTLAESTVRSFLRGTIPGGREVVAEIDRVIAQVRAGDILQPGGAQQAIVFLESGQPRERRVKRRNTFYETETARRIADVLDYAAAHCAIGVVTADFGVGKTEAVKEWRRRTAGKVESVVFEFDEFSSCNKVDFIRALGRMFGIECALGSFNGGLVFRELCDRLREQPCLLIFDQCETVRPRICQCIRQIWDRTADAGVGVVLLAAPILLARLSNGKMADLGALSSRVGVWAPLAGLSKAEMAAIVKQEGIADVDPAAFDLWWQATGGSMRRLLRAIDLLKAKHAGKRITEKTVESVAGFLWGMQIARAA
jgi:DNA transposition AAA+ family ATPase